jgi:AcrR family transcriptional regulator
MTRAVVIDIDDVVRSALVPAQDDEATTRILDAAAALFVTRGIRRCTVEEIAERSGVGRTTVYRRFEHRNQIVEAVLARECHRFFSSILATTADVDRLEDQVVEAFLTGLHTAETSVLSGLVRTQPEVQALFTVDAAPLVAAASGFLVMAFGPVTTADQRRQVAAVAELLVRLAISLVVTGPGAIPSADDDASRAVLHSLFDPLIAPLAALRG